MRVLGLMMIAIGLMFSCQKADFSDLDTDKYQVQARLDAGETPIQILNSGVPVDHIMGKVYQNGYIFYLNAETGEGLVCSRTDIFNDSFQTYYNVWGDANFALPQGLQLEDGIGAGENNTAVLAPICGESSSILNGVQTFTTESGWYLPSKTELMAMHNNLHRLRLVDFSLEYYWTSNVEENKVVCIDFSTNDIPQPVLVAPTAVIRAKAVKKF
ncbi:MAG: hypothetical protein R2799_07500 [Crocinitomicaceae bacterium]